MTVRSWRITSETEAARFTEPGIAGTPEIGSLVVEVVGYGFVEFSDYKKARCGDAVGMKVSFSDHGYIGGVMDRQAVVDLRDYLTAWLSGELPTVRSTP